MEIRVRDTGQVMFESEFRAYQQSIGGPTWDITTHEILNDLGADPVLEGPQVSGEFWQYSMRQGVEQIDGQWFTKYVLGPIFTDRPATETEPAMTAAEQQAKWIAQKTAEKQKALQDSIVSAVEQRLNDFAKTRGYDDIKSASDYAAQNAVPKFQVEGQYALNQRAATWAKLYQMLAEVEAGTRPVPSGYDDIKSELPELVWP